VTVPTVYVVDDDASIRELLGWLMRSNGFPVEVFPDARAFLARCSPDTSGCLIVDLHMPGMSGLDLQREMKERAITMPLLFLSAGADVPKAVQAVREGAVDFIEKPFDYRRVVAVVRDCLARDAAARERRGKQRESAERLAQLTQREREVLDLVVAGRTNREIGEALEISVKTVEAHRAKIMEKFAVDSVAELVQAVLSVTT